MKILLIIIDGLGDRPIPQLGNKTPLEAAKAPNLDWLAQNGICGLVLPYLQNKKPPTSEDTHLALFGYNPKIFNPGRGVLETLGIGMKIEPGDVCLRGNFATVDPKGPRPQVGGGASEASNLKIIDRRAGRIEKTEDLIKAISLIEIEGIKFLIGKAVSHRIGIIMRGRELSSKISNSDPKLTEVRPLPIRALDKSKEAKFTARILNKFLEKTHLILKNHPLNKKRKLPANYILVRGAGELKKIKSFKEKYKLKAAFVAGGTLYKGIGKFLGMEEIKVKGATALPTTNLKGKFLVAKKVLERPQVSLKFGRVKKYDFVFLHIKAADNLGEDGNFIGKRDFIEKIDQNLKPILDLKNTLIVITGDHSTCSLLKRHCSEPIPVLIYGSGRDLVKEFSEKACQKGKLGKIKQLNLMRKILEFC